MSYQLVQTIVTPPNADTVVLAGVYQRETEFIIEVSSSEGERRRWVKAGYVARMFDIPGIGITEGEVYRLDLESKKLTYQPSSDPFRLEFRPVYWLCDYQLKLWVRDPVVLPLTPLTITGDAFTVDGVTIDL